jgi:hypothetical protein
LVCGHRSDLRGCSRRGGSGCHALECPFQCQAEVGHDGEAKARQARHEDRRLDVRLLTDKVRAGMGGRRSQPLRHASHSKRLSTRSVSGGSRELISVQHRAFASFPSPSLASGVANATKGDSITFRAASQGLENFRPKRPSRPAARAVRSSLAVLQERPFRLRGVRRGGSARRRWLAGIPLGHRRRGR